LKEANLAPSTGSSSDGLTIEKVLEEKNVFDVSKNFEKLGVEDKNKGWRTPGKYSIGHGSWEYGLLN